MNSSFLDTMIKIGIVVIIIMIFGIGIYLIQDQKNKERMYVEYILETIVEHDKDLKNKRKEILELRENIMYIEETLYAYKLKEDIYKEIYQELEETSRTVPRPN